MRVGSFAMAVVTLTAVLGAARAEESKVVLGDVPKAGVDAVKTMFPQGEITGAAKETEDGKTVYEVTLKQKGRTIDVTVGTDGQIQIVECRVNYTSGYECRPNGAPFIWISSGSDFGYELQSLQYFHCSSQRKVPEMFARAVLVDIRVFLVRITDIGVYGYWFELDS